GVDDRHAETGEEDRELLLADGQKSRRGVTGAVTGRLPDLLAVVEMEGDDAGVLAADVHQHPAVADDWRGADAEVAAGHLVVLEQRAGPDLGAFVESQAV